MEEQARAGATTRDRLLDAAARVIARDGFRGARLADVAREAGLTTGAVYSNFRDKEELFLAAFDHVQELHRPLPENGDDELDDMISGIAESIRRFGEDRELQILNLELALLGTRNDEIREHLRKSERDQIDRLAPLLPDDSEEDRRQRAILLLGLSNGLALLRMIAGDAVPLEGVDRAMRRLAGLDR